MTLGERIKQHRKQQNMTQEQLAERIGVSAQAVSKWENNLSCPDITILPELAEIFGISTDELLGKHVNVPTVKEEPKQGHWQWQWNMGGSFSSVSIFAIFVILFGGLWLMNELCGFDVSWWTLLWTLTLVYCGISSFDGGFSAIGVVMLLTGAGFLASAYYPHDISMRWSVIIPCCIIIWGLGLVVDMFGKKAKVRRKHRSIGAGKRSLQREYSCEDGRLYCEYSFGQARVPIATAFLYGGEIETNFGDFTFDFSPCQAVAEGCTIHIENNFGKLVLLVPEKFRVEYLSKDNFSASEQTSGEENKNGSVIYVRLECNFGSVQTKYI